jgi:hypothetical protein
LTDKAVPVLPSADLARTAKFYRYFGFEAVQDGDEGWLRLRKDEVEIDFTLSSVDYTSSEHLVCGHVCVIRVADVDSWYASFANTRMNWRALWPSLTKPRDDMWGGLKAFCLTDRDANLIWCVESERQS